MKLVNVETRKFVIPTAFYDEVETMGNFKGYFKGSYLRPEVKKALFKAAKKEIEKNTKCGWMPRRLCNKVKYYMEITFNESTGKIQNSKIGCELVLSPDWVNAKGINAKKYKKYIHNWQYSNTAFDGNLTLMCGASAALDTFYTDVYEMAVIEKILNNVA